MKVRTIKQTAFTDAYTSGAGHLPGSGWIEDLRAKNRAVISAKGLPNGLTEAWKYTSLKAVAETAYIPAAAADGIDVSKLPHTALNLPDATQIVFVNGVFAPELSDELPAGLALLSDVLDRDPDSLKPWIGRLADGGVSQAVALNAGYLGQGVFLHVTSSTQPAKPIHIIHIGAAGDEPVAFHPRTVIVLDAGAEAELVESFVGLPGQPYLHNNVTEIALGAGANLRHVVYQNEDDAAHHLGTAAIRLEAKARYDGFGFSLGGALVRREYHMDLVAPGAHAQLNGIYALNDTQHHDFTTVTNHAAPETTSDQLFKGVLADTAHGVYQGRIHVAREAQQTDGQLLHKALMLNRGPEVSVKPELEIYADDVACAHGAATGEIDADQLFYLMSRGIDPVRAKELLVEGFVQDVISTVPIGIVQDSLTQRLQVWLAGQSGLNSNG